jgi:hypothetical protein
MKRPTLQTLPAEAGTADASAIVTKMAKEIGSHIATIGAERQVARAT